MNFQPSTLALERTPPTVLGQIISNGCTPESTEGGFSRSELSCRLVLALTLGPRSGENCHCDFNELLMDMLARFDNCQAEQIEGEFTSAFRRICEFLEVDDARCWLGS